MPALLCVLMKHRGKQSSNEWNLPSMIFGAFSSVPALERSDYLEQLPNLEKHVLTTAFGELILALFLMIKGFNDDNRELRGAANNA